SPEVRTKPAKAHLNFIRNTYSAGDANETIHLCEISRWKHDLPCSAGHAFGNEYGRASLFLSQMIQDFGDRAGITRSKVEFSSPVNAAIVVRDWGQMDPGFATASARSVEFIWTYVSECVRMAVVGMFHDDRVVAPGSRARQAKSEFVR